MKQVLVTTGATVTFNELIEGVLNGEFLQALTKRKFERIIVQYGKGNYAINLVEKLIKELPVYNVNSYEDSKRGYAINCQYENIIIECIQFDSELSEKYTRFSELVISHAGTGSIIDTLRSGMKGIELIVMVNNKLQDNHQQEIADAFEDLGVLKSVGNAEELLKVVIMGDVKKASKTMLGESRGQLVEVVLCEELIS
jgi:beta-1,4-N-acetylglucosaminyltransferase